MKQNKHLAHREDFATVENWAKALHYSKIHVYRLLRQGKLPGRKPLGRWITPIKDFRTHLKQEYGIDVSEQRA
jgi:predicted DNA-binding transcriptional regulator AlpA